jgi:hypothetical protein
LALLGGIENFYLGSSRTNLQLNKKYIADLVLFSPCVFRKKKLRKEILSFFSPATPQFKKRKYREDMVAVHK